MYELPDEIWDYIKNFVFDKSFWEKLHRHKLLPILNKNIPWSYAPIYKRWTHFPPWPNTNDIILDEYTEENRHWAPRPHLQLTSITWNVKGNGGGWWSGYGWEKTSDTFQNFMKEHHGNWSQGND